MLAVAGDKSTHVLFHCCGGINRRRGFVRLARCRLRAPRTGSRTVATSEKTSVASLAQSTLCLGSVVAPGRFARGIAERLQRSTPRVVCVAGRPSRLFGMKLRHHRFDDGIRNCRKEGRDVDMCLLHLRDNRCTVGTHESLVLIVMSFALRPQRWCFEGPIRKSGDDDWKHTYCALSLRLILEVKLICFEPLLAGSLLAACFWDQDEAHTNPFCARFDLLTVYFVFVLKRD